MDKVISANLLYLDAMQQGVDRQPAYQQDIKRFEAAVLAILYRSKFIYSDVKVSAMRRLWNTSSARPRKGQN